MKDFRHRIVVGSQPVSKELRSTGVLKVDGIPTYSDDTFVLLHDGKHIYVCDVGKCRGLILWNRRSESVRISMLNEWPIHNGHIVTCGNISIVVIDDFRFVVQYLYEVGKDDAVVMERCYEFCPTALEEITPTGMSAKTTKPSPGEVVVGRQLAENHQYQQTDNVFLIRMRDPSLNWSRQQTQRRRLVEKLSPESNGLGLVVNGGAMLSRVQCALALPPDGRLFVRNMSRTNVTEVLREHHDGITAIQIGSYTYYELVAGDVVDLGAARMFVLQGGRIAVNFTKTDYYDADPKTYCFRNRRGTLVPDGTYTDVIDFLKNAKSEMAWAAIGCDLKEAAKLATQFAGNAFKKWMYSKH